jgi:hypothetical protein
MTKDYSEYVRHGTAVGVPHELYHIWVRDQLTRIIERIEKLEEK